MTACPPRPLRRAALAGLVCCAAALVACSSPPSRFYTLSPDTVAAGRTLPANPAFLIQVPSVDVPGQIARNQFVVQKNATQVDILEQERWASPPADEIRRALSTDLTRQLDTIDVADSPAPPGVPVYRVSVDVQRFESWPGKRAAIDAVWSVRALSTQAVMTCRTAEAVPVQSSYDALVAGHRQAIARLAAQIAAGVREMAAAPANASDARGATPARCPANAPAATPEASAAPQ